MNTISKLSILAVLGLASAVVNQAEAQVATPSTTLGAAITSSTANVINLASITSVTAGQTYLYVDGELMQTIGTPTNAAAVKVARGIGAGSGPQTHANGAKVWIGLTPANSVVPGSNGFSLKATLAYPAFSTCTRANETYLPKIFPALGLILDCDANTSVWRPYLVAGPIQFVTDAGAANAITSAVGSTPAYTGITVSVTLAHALQAGANTFAYAGGTALAIKSAKNPANNIATAYVSTGVVNLQLALISSTLTWLDLSQ
jgi:hypothetical protein